MKTYAGDAVVRHLYKLYKHHVSKVLPDSGLIVVVDDVTQREQSKAELNTFFRFNAKTTFTLSLYMEILNIHMWVVCFLMFFFFSLCVLFFMYDLCFIKQNKTKKKNTEVQYKYFNSLNNAL